MKKSFYITTPIYYPSGNWHVGTCYTTVVCDAIARFKRMSGYEVFFLTGTDEHGGKIEEKAAAAGKTPLEFVTPIVDDLKQIWKMLNISYDRFIRTTDPDHVAAVQKIFRTLYEKGEIYKSEYEGWYCTPCEAFWTESQLKDGKCPDCGREVHLEKEESYFFRLSKYADRLRKLFEDNPEFLQPTSRVNEMVNNFLDAGLQDLCVSRTSVKWGIPVDFDPKHVVYVWVDALPNYVSALGYGSDDQTLMKKFWPCNLHMTGKEIIRFHALVWPAILMALGLPLPEKVYGHGWLLIGGDKLSKSKEGAVKTELTDPRDVVERYGADALRYFLLREIPFGSDGVYTNEALLNRINSDLANDLGNLVSRTTAMIDKYFGGVLPEAGASAEPDGELIAVAEGVLPAAAEAVDQINVPKALAEIFKLVGRANKYIDETQPWVLGKSEEGRERLKTVLYNLAESNRIAAVAFAPFIPESAEKILACFNLNIQDLSFKDIEKFGGLRAGTLVKKSSPLFPRIDVKKELADIDEMMHKRAAEKARLEKKSADSAVIAENSKSADNIFEVSADDFAKIDLRVAKVISCEEIAGSDRLLKLTLDVGTEKRTVVSGIRAEYAPQDLIGKRVILVANLKKSKIRGVVSQGMILCAENGGKTTVIFPDDCVQIGSKVR